MTTARQLMYRECADCGEAIPARCDAYNGFSLSRARCEPCGDLWTYEEVGARG